MHRDIAHEPAATDGARGAVQLSDVLADADADGFGAEFDVAEDPSPPDHLHCPTCGSDRPASSYARVWSRRLEGASDPADMLHVSALRCPVCRSAGVFITPFGPGATARQSAVLTALPEPGRDAPPAPPDRT